jgi:hypothetical protein
MTKIRSMGQGMPLDLTSDDAVNEALEKARARAEFVSRFRGSEAYRVACTMPRGLPHGAQLRWLTAQPQIVEWLFELVRDAKEQECDR